MGDFYLFGVLDLEGRVKLGASKGILLHVASRIQTCLGFGKAFSTQEAIKKNYRYKQLDYQVKGSFVARRTRKSYPLQTFLRFWKAFNYEQAIREFCMPIEGAQLLGES